MVDPGREVLERDRDRRGVPVPAVEDVDDATARLGERFGPERRVGLDQPLLAPAPVFESPPFPPPVSESRPVAALWAQSASPPK